MLRRKDIRNMQNKKYILFDLDGTLTASDEGIIKSVQYALKQFGIYEQDTQKLKLFVGPPLRVAFPKFYGMNEQETEEAISFYRERYATKGLFENQVYDGIVDMLNACYDKGYTLMLATSKPKVYADKILQHFGLSEYFTHVVGPLLDGTLDAKSDIIKYAMELCEDTDKSAYIMIGDRFYDIEGANICGIDSIGVLYGYGTEQELVNSGATYICKTTSDLKNLLTKS